MAIKKEDNLIGDSGLVKKNDPIGLATIIGSNVLIAVLILLSVLAFL